MEAIEEVVSLVDHATALLFDWVEEAAVDAIVSGDLDAKTALAEADASGFRIGASLGETLHVVDVLARFVADQLTVDCPPLQDRRALIAAFDEADDIARTVVDQHPDVFVLEDSYFEPAVVYGEVLVVHSDWRLFQEELLKVLDEIEAGACSSLLDLGCCLFVLDRVGVDRFRGGMFWVRSRVRAAVEPIEQ